MSKVILITGATKGFGRIWAEAFLKRGDSVIAAGRNITALEDLKNKYGDLVLPIQLDVNDRKASFEAVNKAKEHFGRIDVLINNAGYGLFGAVEETSEEEARNQMETNFFGVLWLTQAVLPIMREQKSGHIIQVSSFLGLITLPVLGLYNASKFAVEGLTETLASEVKGFGINVSLVEPNGYTTDWSGESAFQTQSLSVYDPVKAGFKAAVSAPGIFGNPEATANVILKLVDNDNPPLRLLLGSFAYPAVKKVYEERLEGFEEWKLVSEEAHGA
ncbi:SDR family NAD(P)-dependent oxidoreductase [Flavobacterium reichenbachii]|uniref:Short-chain dehydrogenase n=1 Tax=Flavobacterium reichenbachii TaxID=362418 RepID=A0A085ZF30_9FLAO|nr:SDR family NAD(P)-dependent oxidoreductase [Flavobacterium reichenbachii]KFF03044.1 short-chain dehydrogenase [Flavobacterium reichenbachii]OXB17189.1 short-chain dehydrogenase/reductase [Flavobacterium reichenbachii]